MKHTIVIISICLYCLNTAAQLPAQLTVTNYNETNGIDNGRVTAMLQATNGYLWFGTTNGLLRFDGYQFRPYNSPVIINSISKMAEDSNHCIWMSFLGGGLARFDPASGVFTPYIIKSSKDPLLATAEISKLFFDSKGQLWIAVTQKGIVKADFTNDKFTVYDIVPASNNFYTPEFRKIYNTVYNFYEDGSYIWLATHDGLYKFGPSAGSMIPVRAKPLVRNSRRFDLFGHLVPDNDLIWLSAWAGGISSYNKKNGEWNLYLPEPAEIDNTLSNGVINIERKSDHELWLGHGGKGLGIFNTVTKTFFFFTNNKLYPTVPEADWSEILVDNNKNIWGMNRNGLLKVQVPEHRFNYKSWTVKSKMGVVFYLTDMLEDDNRRFTSTSFADGLYVLDKKTGKERTIPVDFFSNGEQSFDIRQLMKDSKGNTWVITRDYICLYDTIAEKLVKIKQPPTYSAEKFTNSFTGIAEDKDGNMWITTKRNGIFVYSVKNENYIHYGNAEHGNAFINAAYLTDIAVDAKGRVWAGGPYGFLGYAVAAEKKFTELKKQTAAHPIPLSIQTYSLFADSGGNIWAGTFGGLYFYDCSGDSPVLKKILTAKDALRSNLVTNIQEDPLGNIWCITEAGVCSINPKNLKITSYHTIDGITGPGANIKITRAWNGEMRLLTSGGYYSFNYEDKQTVGTAAPLRVTNMMVNDKDIYYEAILEKEGKISLAPSQNVFSFEFAAINFNRTDKQQYSYMLKGFDKDWIDAGNRRFVSYTNLPGGNYVFMVRLDAGKGPTKEAVINIPIYIRTPFYKTIVFFISLAVLLLGLVYWLYRYRINQHRQVHSLQSKTQLLEKEKAMVMYEGLKQQLNPHFLFNSLTSLSGLIQTNQVLAGNFLEQMSKIYRYILKNRDRETVTLAQEITFLESYVQLQQTRFGKGLQVYIDIDPDHFDRKIAPVTLQNLMENAIKHNIIDTNSPLRINIVCDETYLVMENNLQKKDFVETSNQQGLASMKSLYKYLTNTLIVIEETDQTFTIKIPLI
ncbi:MAG: histidine kinase [Rhizobacter sp.]|nr:histidine kinase [Ferruginibacter sp.]